MLIILSVQLKLLTKIVHISNEYMLSLFMKHNGTYKYNIIDP